MLRNSSPADRPHSTNAHEANMRHLIKAILDADRLFILKENHNSTNYTHLPMHIRKLIHHRNHICKQNRSDPQIITLNNHINKQIHDDKTNTWKQHLDKIDRKHNPHSLWATITKLFNKKHATEQKHSFRTKTAITDIDKSKAFNK